jgi:hypothetical protein
MIDIQGPSPAGFRYLTLAESIRIARQAKQARTVEYYRAHPEKAAELAREMIEFWQAYQASLGGST